MKTVLLAAIASVMITTSGQAFFNLPAPAKEPPAGNCKALVQQYGLDSVWYGEYSGFEWDYETDREYPYARRGCFTSQNACRVWQQQTMTFTRGGRVGYTACTQPVPKGQLR